MRLVGNHGVDSMRCGSFRAGGAFRAGRGSFRAARCLKRDLSSRALRVTVKYDRGRFVREGVQYET